MYDLGETVSMAKIVRFGEFLFDKVDSDVDQIGQK